ncbi:MAG: DUF433 domain-containing protein [Saprospiraceae bacterium]|nr:DUF433 domain-containing protein [Saprospiraceae bacterium]
MTINEILTIQRDVQFGTPVFKGTRVPAAFLFDFLEDGLTITQFIEEFPSVQREQAVNLLEWTNGLVKSSKIFDFHENFA